MENLSKYISQKYHALLNSKYSFESLFYHVHNQDSRIFCEYFDYCVKREVSYKHFKDYCYKTGSNLLKLIGYQNDKYVGLYMDNGTNWIANFWGLLMIGAKPVLLNCKMPVNLTNEIIELLNIENIICGQALSQTELKGNKVVVVDTIALSPEIEALPLLSECRWADNIALITTATSLNYKICVYQGAEMFHQVVNSEGILQRSKLIKTHYKGRLKLLTFLPFYHVFGLIATYLWFGVYGRTFVFLNDYSGDTILKTTRAFEVTHIFGVPLLWNTLSREILKQVNRLSPKDKAKFDKGIRYCLRLQNAFPNYGMKRSQKIFKRITDKTLGRSIKFLITGGGYISEETLKLFNALGYPLHNGYGSTEIGITSVELRKRPKDRIQGSIGIPFDNVNYKIVDDELYFKGPSSCSKIIYRDGKEAITNHDEWYKTNDSASKDKRGYYYINGRVDDVIVGENGEKLNLDLIEKKLFFTSVGHYAIINRIIEGKSKLILVVEVSSTINDIALSKINREMSDNLKAIKELGYQVEGCFSYDKIANANAIKVSRKYLNNKLDSGEIKLINFSDVKAECEKKTVDDVMRNTIDTIKKIFANVLDKAANEIGDESHFIFDLGGSSLDYCSVLFKLESEFGVTFEFKDTSCSNAYEFAKYIVDFDKGDKGNEKI